MNLSILFAVGIDWLLGDPSNWPHPIRFIGWIIRTYEKIIRKRSRNLYVGGFLLLLLSLISVVSLIEIIRLIIHPTFYKILEIYFLYTCIAARCLSDEGNKIKKLIIASKLEESRVALSYIVGRDTKNLNEAEITKGVVETVSENTIDGVLAPIFYMILGSFFNLTLEFALIYKTVNTLDSMVGYIQDPYIEIGFFSAKCDDALNWIPARIGAMLMLFSGMIMKMDIRNGLKIFKRDRRNHKSPNSGFPESAVAGLLNIQLGGSNTYFGKLVEKPSIGDANTTLNAKHIENTVQIMFLSEIIVIVIYSLIFLV